MRRPRRRGALTLLAVAGLCVPVVGLGAGADAAQPPPDLSHLDPGGAAHVTQDVPVTVVYVGLEEGAPPLGIDASATEAAQPESAVIPNLKPPRQRPILPLGVDYTYSYDIRFADNDFEDAFFGYLSTIAFGPLGPTEFQTAYSQQRHAAHDITENWIIDALAAEAWLNTEGAARLGIDPARPTVYFVNWYGRPDFRFHTYADFHRLPNLPLPLGVLGAGQITAFGGSTPDDPQAPGLPFGRTWFYDVSAGPDYVTSNWSLTVPEMPPFDGVPDRRIPPVWEYGTTHWFMPFLDLGADLADVLRFVAVDMLFTPTPVYDPALSPPLLSDSVNVDVNVFTEEGGLPPPDIAPSLASWRALDPSRQFTADQSTKPLAQVEEPYECFRSAFAGNAESCFASAGVPLSDYDLGVVLDATRQRYMDFTNYEVPVAHYAIPDHRLPFFAIAGYALDEHRFGVQNWTHVWDSPTMRQIFVDPAFTTTHEVGHHLGLPHFHNGYDSERGISLDPFGPFGFTWIGNGTASAMSYLGTTMEFSQFDRDSMDRWMVAVRLQWANRILADIYDAGAAGPLAAELLEADALAGEAQALVDAWDLRGASIAARDAYAKIVEAAGVAGVAVESWTARADQGPTGWAAWIEDPVVTGSGSPLAARAMSARDRHGPEPQPLLPPGAESVADLDHTPLLEPPP